MLIIRMSRIGKKNQPSYRLTISEKARDPYGKVLEILGFYNPRSKELQAKEERLKHWLSKGAKMTDTVNNLLVTKKLVDGKIISTVSKKTKKKEGKKA